MKKFFTGLIMLMGLLAFTEVSAQTTGVVGGVDTDYTTYYNTVWIYNSDGDNIGKAVMSYDREYQCYNNIKYYNFTPANNYVYLIVKVGGIVYFNQEIWIEGNSYTYIDDAFKHCYSSRETLNVIVKSSR